MFTCSICQEQHEQSKLYIRPEGAMCSQTCRTAEDKQMCQECIEEYANATESDMVRCPHCKADMFPRGARDELYLLRINIEDTYHAFYYTDAEEAEEAENEATWLCSFLRFDISLEDRTGQGREEPQGPWVYHDGDEMYDTVTRITSAVYEPKKLCDWVREKALLENLVCEAFDGNVDYNYWFHSLNESNRVMETRYVPKLLPQTMEEYKYSLQHLWDEDITRIDVLDEVWIVSLLGGRKKFVMPMPLVEPEEDVSGEPAAKRRRLS